VNSLEEGFAETLTVHQLGLFEKLGRSFKTTNALENVNNLLWIYTDRVDYWKASEQRQRRVPTALLEVEPRLPTVAGRQHLKQFRCAIAQLVGKRKATVELKSAAGWRARKRGGCMFGLFKSKPFRDPQLGEFRRSGDYWKGSLIVAPCGTFRLALAGSREAPDPIALGLAKELPDRFKSLVPKIQTGLFEHYAPYKEAVDAGEESGSPCPSVASPETVWPYVTPAHVLVEPLEGVPTVEIAFKVGWDVEHTVGARFQNWQFVELNGSVRGR